VPVPNKKEAFVALASLLYLAIFRASPVVEATAAMAFAPMDPAARHLGGVVLLLSIAPVIPPLGEVATLGAVKGVTPSLVHVGPETPAMVFVPMERAARHLGGAVLLLSIAPVIPPLGAVTVVTPSLVHVGPETPVMVFAPMELAARHLGGVVHLLSIAPVIPPLEEVAALGAVAVVTLLLVHVGPGTPVMVFAPMELAARNSGGVVLLLSIAPVIPPLAEVAALGAVAVATLMLVHVGPETPVMVFAPMELAARNSGGAVLLLSIAPVIPPLGAVTAATPLLVRVGPETAEMVFAPTEVAARNSGGAVLLLSIAPEIPPRK
jgi:hypothetical protein